MYPAAQKQNKNVSTRFYKFGDRLTQKSRNRDQISINCTAPTVCLCNHALDYGCISQVCLEGLALFVLSQKVRIQAVEGSDDHAHTTTDILGPGAAGLQQTSQTLKKDLPQLHNIPPPPLSHLDHQRDKSSLPNACYRGRVSRAMVGDWGSEANSRGTPGLLVQFSGHEPSL